MTVPWTEILGYVASVTVAVSLMMASHVRLRIISLVGSTLFALYGFLIQAYPVGAMNTFIAIINLYFLVRIARSRTLFSLLSMPARDAYFDRFLEVHRTDIAVFFPSFRPEDVARADAGGLSLYILRNAVTAGVFAAHRDPDDPGTAVVDLDYVIPEYRDYRTARFLFAEQAGFFRQAGIRRLVAVAHVPAHEKYLRRVGFVALPEDGTEGPLRFAMSIPREAAEN